MSTAAAAWRGWMVWAGMPRPSGAQRLCSTPRGVLFAVRVPSEQRNGIRGPPPSSRDPPRPDCGVMTNSRSNDHGCRARRARRAVGLSLLSLLAVPVGAGAEMAPGVSSAIGEARPGERLPVLVLLHAQVDANDRQASGRALVASLRATAGRTQPSVAALTSGPDRSFWLVNAMSSEASPREIRALAAHPAVARVTLDPPVSAMRFSAEPLSAAPSGWGVLRVGAPRVWGDHALTGAGVTIGSIDTGIDASHPALAGRVAAWRDFVNGSAVPYDDNGHGTHTIGTMVGSGSIGVAPGARVVVAKALDAGGAGRGSDILAAAQWLTDPDGDPATDDRPDVINNSWGTAGASNPWFRPMVRQWLALGIVPVFAAGNTGPSKATISSPADYPESFAVGAHDGADALAPFSSRGPVVWSHADDPAIPPGTPLGKPDVSAPGVGVASTVPGGGYAQYSGTSMAAPHVAGVAALLRQARPALDPVEVMDLMRRTAADRGPVGHDDGFGAGVIDAPGVLAAAGVTAPPSTPQTQPVTPVEETRPELRRPRAAPAPVRRAEPRVRLTLAQMRSSRRIALAAARRVDVIEARLHGRSTLRSTRANPRVRLQPRDMRITRRIAQTSIVRIARLERRLGTSLSTRAVVSSGGARTRLTVQQMRVTDRLARTALARAADLGRVVRSRVATRGIPRR